MQSGESIRKTAARYRVSTNFIVRLRQQYRATGQLTPKPRGGNRRPRVDQAGGVWLIELLQREPSLTLAELCRRYARGDGVRVSKSSMDRTLQRLGISYKKTPVDPHRYTERVQQLTAEYQAELAGVDPHQVVFLDEAGAGLNLILDYGRSPIRASLRIRRRRRVDLEMQVAYCNRLIQHHLMRLSDATATYFASRYPV